jgi:predicted O-methyltransferase YrrM
MDRDARSGSAADASSALGTRQDPDAQARLAREMPALLHSISEFQELIAALVKAVAPDRAIEIGGESGSSARAYVAAGVPEVITIDVAPTAELRAAAESDPRITLVEERSPQALAGLPPSTFWVIDGDHNYSVVRAELEAILARNAQDERDSLLIFHDVIWPCGRRDQYYDPDALASEDVHPHRWDAGATIWSEELSADGFVGAGSFATAMQFGGEANGVLTAIEDVLEGRDDLELAIVPAVFGLGVIYSANAPWSGEVSAIMRPWDRSQLLLRLECNRIALYLRVLQLQNDLETRLRQFERHTGGLDREISRLRSEIATVRADVLDSSP